MKQTLMDIIGFLKDVSQIDFLLYFAILVLIILVVSLIYIIKNSDEEEVVKKDNNISSSDDLNLSEVVQNLENMPHSSVEMTNYEKEQEEKAIISYDELVQRNKNANINYNEEKILDDDISIKKINLDNIIEEKETDKPQLMRYAEEEAFLKALKNLNELLNQG